MIETLKKCPFCAEEINSEAVLCKHCKSSLESNIPDNTLYFEAKGHNGQLTLYSHKIVIKRKGFYAWLTYGFAGDKEIKLSSITSVQFKKAGIFTPGFIQFAFMGGQENKKALFAAKRDENSVVFHGGQQKQFELFKQNIDELLNGSKISFLATATTAKAPKKKLGWLPIVLSVIGFFVVMGIIGSFLPKDNSSNDKSDTSNKSSSESSDKPTYIKIGETFQLGNFTYSIKKPSYKKSVGGEYMAKKADDGASFVVVPFSIKNDSKETKTVMSDNFEIDTDGGDSYKPDTDACTAVAMETSKDLILTELFPGIKKSTVTVFEVPIQATKGHLYLKVPEEDWGSGSATVLLK